MILINKKNIAFYVIYIFLILLFIEILSATLLYQRYKYTIPKSSLDTPLASVGLFNVINSRFSLFYGNEPIFTNFPYSLIDDLKSINGGISNSNNPTQIEAHNTPLVRPDKNLNYSQFNENFLVCFKLLLPFSNFISVRAVICPCRNLSVLFYNLYVPPAPVTYHHILII